MATDIAKNFMAQAHVPLNSLNAEHCWNVREFGHKLDTKNLGSFPCPLDAYAHPRAELPR